MRIFIDTSAFYAVLDQDDENHAAATEVWRRLLQDDAALLTSNYVLVETSALIQRRLGIAALRAFQEDIVPLLGVEWIDEIRHRAAIEMALAASRKRLSLVDCSSFLVMREVEVRRAFCFDRHFREQGFSVLP